MGEPGGLPSMGSHRVGHNWSDLAAVAAWNYMKSCKWNFKIVKALYNLKNLSLNKNKTLNETFPLKKTNRDKYYMTSLIYRLLKDKLMKILKTQNHRYIHQTIY